MWYEFDGMHSIHLQSAPSIQHLCTPLFSLTLIRHPLVIPCCVVLCLASFLSEFSLEHTYSVSFIPSKVLLKMHISWYHHPTMVSQLAIWFSLLSLFSIFPACYLWKWQCYLQSLSSGFADRENGGGDHIWLGHGLWWVIGCAYTWLHLRNLICSQCRESQRQASGSEWRGRDATHGTTLWDWKKLMNWEKWKKRKTENDPWWW